MAEKVLKSEAIRAAQIHRHDIGGRLGQLTCFKQIQPRGVETVKFYQALDAADVNVKSLQLAKCYYPENLESKFGQQER